MKSFTYVITDRVGIHARPAGILVKEAQKYGADISVRSGEKQADAKQLMQLMSLGAKCGDEICVTASGTDEEAACSAVQEVLREYL